MGGDHYDDFYYTHYGPAQERYDRDEPRWGELFRNMADRIAREIAPATVLDAGCAKGFLVEALRDRGIEAFGIDVSEHAIESVREDIRPHCSAGSLSDPLPQRYDLITCIEVLEHIPVESVDSVVANLCEHTDDVLMSSTPDEFGDPTHLNVRPAEYWIEIFGRHDFHHDLLYDPSFIQPWAMRLRRNRDPAPRIFAEYEREVQRLRAEVRDRTALILQQRDELAEKEHEVERLHTEQGRSELEVRVAHLTEEVSRLEDGLLASEQGNAELTQHVINLQALVHSTTVRGAVHLRDMAFRVMPKETRRGRVMVRTAHGLRRLARDGTREFSADLRSRMTGSGARARDETLYPQWVAQNEPTGSELTRLRLEALSFSDRPTFSIVMPVYNSEPEWLDAAICSMLDQAYDRWELCIADDASSAAHVRPLLEAFAARDQRIKVTFREQNGGIAAASNSALSLATGDVVGFLDHDDVLRPHALATMARALREHPSAGFIYSDEDKLLPDGRRGEPFLKPDWSPDLMLSSNYVCHFAVVRRDLVEKVGGFRPAYDGSQDYDLFLRVVDTGCDVHHVPMVLYSWRQVVGSAALSTAAKPYAYEAALRSLQDSLQRRGVAGHIEPGAQLGWYFARYEVPKDAEVTIVIPTRDRADLLRRCLQSIAATTKGSHPAILLVDNGSTDPDTVGFLAGTEHRVLRHPGAFNYSRIINAAVRATETPAVLLLNNDVEALHQGWLDAMLEQVMRPEVGAVGGRLRYPDGRVQHEGITVGYQHTAASNIDFGGYFGLGDAIRDCAAVTGACMMVRRSVFDEVGGFDETMRVAFNDVDFCLRVSKAGYRIIYTPLATLVHEESATRGRLHPIADEQLFRRRWDHDETLRDPYINANIAELAPLRLRVR